jgi:CHAT domain-containing protein/tetratricopeptide (TPR) repeat protein
MTLVLDDLPARITQVLQLARSDRDDEAVHFAREIVGGLPEPDALPALDTLADGLNSLGVFFFDRAYAADARRAYEAAIGVAARLVPPNTVLTSKLHNNLGQAEERLGNFAEARTHLETSLRLKEDSSESPLAAAITQDNLAAVLTRLGESERAAELMHASLETFERHHGEVHADVATVLGNLGWLHAENGDVTRARAAYLRSLDIHIRAGGVESQGALVSAAKLVKLCLEVHDHRLAGELADLLLAVGGEHPTARHHVAAVTLFGLGQTAFEMFSLGMASRLAARAWTLLSAIEGPFGSTARQAKALLANVHAAQGDRAEAERLQLEVLDAPGQSPAEQARALIDLGKSLRSRGRTSFPAAVAMFEHARRLLREHPDTDQLVSALGNLGQLRFENDEPSIAEGLYREARAVIGTDTSRHDLPWIVHNQAMLAYHQGHHDEALRGYRMAARLWTRRLGRGHPFTATVEANLALVHWAVADVKAAARSFTASQRLRAPEMARTLAVGSERQRVAAVRDGLGDLYKVVTFHLATRAAGELAASMLLRYKGAVLDAVAQSQARLRGRLDPSSRLKFDRLAELQRLMADAIASESMLGGAADPAAVSRWQTEAEQLQAALGQQSAFGQSALAPVTLEAVRAALPKDAALVEYLRYPPFEPVRAAGAATWRDARYAAMLLRRSGDPIWMDLGEASAIDAAAQQLRARLADPDSEDVDAAVRAMAALVVDPLRARLENARLLLVAPDGPLHLLPFALLLAAGGATGRALSLLGGGRELLQPDEAAGVTPPVAIVDPDFGRSAGALDMESLPGTRAESAALQALWPDVRVLARDSATVEALRAVERPALLHLATHGHFQPPAAVDARWDTHSLMVDGEFLVVQRASPSVRTDAMLHGGLALSGANRSTPDRPTGLISAAELAQLDLRGTSLVVLSACDTGLGTAGQGEELAGLRRAFALAGSRSQITSLWWVGDGPAGVFMTTYYRRVHEGATRAAAMRDAQQRVRETPGWSHPAFWAGFALWGDPGPLPQALRRQGGSS